MDSSEKRSGIDAGIQELLETNAEDKGDSKDSEKVDKQNKVCTSKRSRI